MPRKPVKGEKKTKFISRCIRYLMKKEGKDHSQAAAICYSMWEERNKK